MFGVTVEQQTDINFRDLFEFLRRGLLLAALVALAAGAAAYFISTSLEPVYEARATLLASRPEQGVATFNVSLVTAPSVDVSAYRVAAQSFAVAQDALRALGTAEPSRQQTAEFIERTAVRTEDTQISSLVHLDVRNEDPALAAAEANALAEALLDWERGRATRNLENIISTLEAQIAGLDQQIRALGVVEETPETSEQYNALLALRADQVTQLNSARALRTSAVGRLEVVESALEPLSPSAPRPLLNTALAMVLGVFLTYGVLLLRNALDTRLRGSDDLAQETGLPVLAEFPKQAAGMRRLPQDASSYLRTNLLFATADASPKIILVTSAGSAQGKSSVALSLAESFAKNDYKTLLVDADLRKPVLGKEYNLSALMHPPLRDFLEHPKERFEVSRVDLERQRQLFVVPSFTAAPNPTELLGKSFRQRLDEWRQHFDVIVIDSAPLLPVADTLTLAPLSTGVVLAISLPDANRRNVRASVELLSRIGVQILGVVATNMTDKHRSSEGYGYGYGYGPDPERPEKQGRAKGPNRLKMPISGR